MNNEILSQKNSILNTAKLPTPNPWIKSPIWDLFWILSSFWVLPIILFTKKIDPLYAIGVFLFWIAHRFFIGKERAQNEGIKWLWIWVLCGMFIAFNDISELTEDLY